jgi:REP element-mobilizing transposase RayT
MAKTYSKIYLHIVFSVVGKEYSIPVKHKEELRKYFTRVLLLRNQKLLAISCMPDHIHLFIDYKLTFPLPNLVRDIQADSSDFINRQGWVKGTFNWQEGFGVFSYSHSQKSRVIKYIQDQEKHHSKISFKEEYLKLMKSFEVDHDEKNLFDLE